jgi:hypothetical protein
VEAAAAAGGFERARSKLVARTLTLDATGWREAAAAVSALERRLAEIETASGERLQGPSRRSLEAGVALMLFEAPPADA